MEGPSAVLQLQSLDGGCNQPEARCTAVLCVPMLGGIEIGLHHSYGSHEDIHTSRHRYFVLHCLRLQSILMQILLDACLYQPQRLCTQGPKRVAALNHG